MKIRFLIFALALFSYTFVSGQNKHQDLYKIAESHTEKMAVDLNLTENQRELIQRQNMIWLDQQVRYEKLETKTAEQKQYMENLKQDYIKNVTNTLTDDQRASFKTSLSKTKFLKY